MASGMGTAPFRGHVRAPPDNRLTSSALAGFQDQTWLGSGEPARGAQGVEPLSPTPTQRSGPSNEKERTFSATFAPTGSPSTNPAAAALAGPPAWAAKPQGWQQQHSQHAAQRLGAEQLQQEKIRGWQCCKLGCQRELSSLACGVEHSHELSVPGAVLGLLGLEASSGPVAVRDTASGQAFCFELRERACGGLYFKGMEYAQWIRSIKAQPGDIVRLEKAEGGRLMVRCIHQPQAEAQQLQQQQQRQQQPAQAQAQQAQQHGGQVEQQQQALRAVEAGQAAGAAQPQRQPQQAEEAPISQQTQQWRPFPGCQTWEFRGSAMRKRLTDTACGTAKKHEQLLTMTGSVFEKLTGARFNARWDDELEVRDMEGGQWYRMRCRSEGRKIILHGTELKGWLRGRQAEAGDWMVFEKLKGGLAVRLQRSKQQALLQNPLPPPPQRQPLPELLPIPLPRLPPALQQLPAAAAAAPAVAVTGAAPHGPTAAVIAQGEAVLSAGGAAALGKQAATPGTAVSSLKRKHEGGQSEVAKRRPAPIKTSEAKGQQQQQQLQKQQQQEERQLGDSIRPPQPRQLAAHPAEREAALHPPGLQQQAEQAEQLVPGQLQQQERQQQEEQQQQQPPQQQQQVHNGAGDAELQPAGAQPLAANAALPEALPEHVSGAAARHGMPAAAPAVAAPHSVPGRPAPLFDLLLPAGDHIGKRLVGRFMAYFEEQSREKQGMMERQLRSILGAGEFEAAAGYMEEKVRTPA